MTSALQLPKHLMCSILTGFMMCLSATAYAQSPQLCTYESKTYSDGAYVCAQRSMMLQCTASGANASWKIVADKDLSKLCPAPVARRDTTKRHAKLRHTPIRRAAASVQDVPANPSAKCFQFNGKRYCE